MTKTSESASRLARVIYNLSMGLDVPEEAIEEANRMGLLHSTSAGCRPTQQAVRDYDNVPMARVWW